jgi:hypothetical protein
MSANKPPYPESNVGKPDAGADPPAPQLPATPPIAAQTVAVKPKPLRIDFDDAKVTDRWKKLITSKREIVVTDVLRISVPRTKLDPIAKAALDKLVVRLIELQPAGSGLDHKTPADLETLVRDTITREGIAVHVKKITDRLNARRITDTRRLVLEKTYVFLMWKLFREQTGQTDSLKKIMKDDLGVAERIILDLEAERGPFDVFTNLIVDSVMERNRINKSKTLQELASQKVRAAFQ